jgi:hypothetical protein
MPVYKNTSNTTVAIGPVAIRPQEVVETPIILETFDPTLAEGTVQRISDEPYFTPVINSVNEDLKKGNDVTYTGFNGSAALIVIVSGGPVEVYFNGINPPLIVGGTNYPVRYLISLGSIAAVEKVRVVAQNNAHVEIHGLTKRLPYQETFSPD